jgi:hypothetical protein
MDWISDTANVVSAVGTVGVFAVAMYLLRKEQHREALRVGIRPRCQARDRADREAALDPQSGALTQDAVSHVDHARPDRVTARCTGWSGW